MRFPGFQTCRNYLANRRTSPQVTPVRTSPSASSNGTSQYYSAQESPTNSQGEPLRPQAPSNVTQLEQENETLKEHLSDIMYSKQLLRMRCIRTHGKHKMNRWWNQVEKNLVEEANRIVHAGDCAFDALLLDERGDLDCKHPLGIRSIDIDTYEDMYGIKPAERKRNLDNKALVDVTNIIATVSMEKELNNDDIHGFRTRARLVQDVLLGRNTVSASLIMSDLDRSIQDLEIQRDTLLQVATDRYNIKKQQAEQVARDIRPYNERRMQELAVDQSLRLRRIADNTATLGALTSPNRIAETQSLKDFSPEENAPVGMARVFRTPENARSRGDRSRGGWSVGRTPSKKTAAESPSTEVSPDSDASLKEILPQTDPFKTLN